MSNNETKATCPAEDDQPNISGCVLDDCFYWMASGSDVVGSCRAILEF